MTPDEAIEQLKQLPAEKVIELIILVRNLAESQADLLREGFELGRNPTNAWGHCSPADFIEHQSMLEIWTASVEHTNEKRAESLQRKRKIFGLPLEN